MKKVYLLGFILAATAASQAIAAGEGGQEVVVAAPGAVGVAAPQPGCPKAFQGFFLGANIGYDVGTGNHKVSVDGENGEDGEDHRNFFKSRLGPHGVDGGVDVGYRHRWCNWMAGIGFSANWANTKAKTHVNVDLDDFDEIKSKVRLENSLDLYATFGYVMREIAMPYIKLGWENARWKHHIAFGEGADSIKKKERLNSFLWGLGVEFLATRHTSVGFEYTGVYGEKITKHLDGVKSSFKPQNNKFALTFKFIY